MAELLEPITLTGRHVQLEPLALEHVDGLVAAATVDRDTYGYTDVPGERGGDDGTTSSGSSTTTPTDVCCRSPSAGSTPVSSSDARGSWSRGGGAAGTTPTRSRSAARGWRRPRSAPPSTRRPSICCCRTPSSSGTSGGSRSAPTRTTLAAGPRSSGSAPRSRACCATIACATTRPHQSRATRPCTRSPMPTGPSVKRSLEQRLPDTPMKVLLVVAHPCPDSFTHACAAAAGRGLTRAGHTVDTIDLYADDFRAAMSREERVAYESERSDPRPDGRRSRVAAAAAPTRSCSSTRRGGAGCRRCSRDGSSG